MLTNEVFHVLFCNIVNLFNLLMCVMFMCDSPICGVWLHILESQAKTQLLVQGIFHP